MDVNFHWIRWIWLITGAWIRVNLKKPVCLFAVTFRLPIFCHWLNSLNSTKIICENWNTFPCNKFKCHRLVGNIMYELITSRTVRPESLTWESTTLIDGWSSRIIGRPWFCSIFASWGWFQTLRSDKSWSQEEPLHVMTSQWHQNEESTWLWRYRNIAESRMSIDSIPVRFIGNSQHYCVYLFRIV